MGRQILFYMSEEDDNDFVDYIRRADDVAILPQTSEQELKETFRSFRDLEGRRLGESCHLWNRSLSPTPIVKHYPRQGYYWLDFMQSEVVNVMRSKMTDQGLSMGRIHIEDQIRESDGSMLPKRDQFITWFADLCRWIEKHSQRTVDGAHVLPGAYKMLERGVAVTGHSF